MEDWEIIKGSNIWMTSPTERIVKRLVDDGHKNGMAHLRDAKEGEI